MSESEASRHDPAPVRRRPGRPGAGFVVIPNPATDQLGDLVVRAIVERHPQLDRDPTITNGRVSATPLDVLRGVLAGSGAFVVVRTAIEEWFSAISRATGLGEGVVPAESLVHAGVTDDALMSELAALLTAPELLTAEEARRRGTPPEPPPTRLPLERIAAEIAEQAGERVVARVAATFGPAFLEWLQQITTPAPPVPQQPRRRRPARRPRRAPQATFPAARELGLALTDGPTGRYWSVMPAEVGIVHAITGRSSLRTELVGAAMAEWFGMPAAPQALMDEIAAAGLPAALLLHEVVALVLEHPGYVDVALDDLIPAAGWGRPRSTVDRAEKRRRIWRWLTIYHAARVIGGRWRPRPGRGGDPMPMRDALIVLGGVSVEGQLSLDGSAPPAMVTIGAGPYLAEHRSDRRMLTSIADVRRIAAIPAGKVSGAWAQALSLTLDQHWRQSATAPTGPLPLSREELLETFRPSPTVRDVLAGNNPDRARRYFTDALRDARKAGAIGPYVEPSRISTRQGWAEAWLAECVEISPPSDVADDLAAIARAAERLR